MIRKAKCLHKSGDLLYHSFYECFFFIVTNHPEISSTYYVLNPTSLEWFNLNNFSLKKIS